VLGSSIYGNDLEDINKKQALRCNNHCAFGFVADVEGELTCRCFDPCSVSQRCMSCTSGISHIKKVYFLGYLGRKCNSIS